MKLVYFGSDVFLSCFEYFTHSHEVLALYTYHNDEDYFTEYAIVQQAQALHIPVHYERITPEEITRLFTEEGCELLFIAEYDRIVALPDDLPAFRGINTHSSLLPQGRSYYPVEAAMERNLTHSGVTMHKLSPHLDQGDILAQRTVEITPETDSVDVYLRCAAHAREMIEEIVGDLEGCWQRAAVQREKLPYWKRPADALLTLTHEMTCAEALAVFRRFNSMTEVAADGARYYVSGLTAGTAPLDAPLRRLSPTLLLYRVRDGHLRLHIRSKEG